MKIFGQLFALLPGAFGLFEDSSDVVGKIDRAGITVHSREARAANCAATAVALDDGKLKGCPGFEGQRFCQFVNGSGGFSEFGIDGPAGGEVAINAAVDVPARLAEGRGDAGECNFLAVNLEFEFVDNEIGVFLRGLIAARSAFMH